MDDPKPAAQEKVVEFLTKVNASTLHNLQTSLKTDEAFEAFDIRNGIPNYKLYDKTGKQRFHFALYDDEEQQVIACDKLDIKLRELLAE